MVKDDAIWLIQVKRRLNDKPESIETIRLLNGVLLREGKYHGMVVTSARSFTKNATKEASIKTTGPYAVRLIDRGGIMEMFSKIPTLDFHHFLAEQYPHIRMSPLSDDMVRLLAGSFPQDEPAA
jgi:hypothetical protein